MSQSAVIPEGSEEDLQNPTRDSVRLKPWSSPSLRSGMTGFLLSATLLLAACDSTGSHVCTTSFAYITVVVHDQNGAAVPDLVIRDSIPRTGEWLTIQQVGGPGSDRYTIFSDGYQSSIKESGDVVAVIGSKTGAAFHAVYQFGIEGGCHVSKISGPDTVVVQ